jgi:RNA polymerase sigma-70 factor (subfamily 1)
MSLGLFHISQRCGRVLMSGRDETLPADDALLAKAVDGDEDALAGLLRRFGPRVRSELSIGEQWQSVLDLDDVMQVTYLEAFLRIGCFVPRGQESFLAWLRRIAKNNLRDAIKALERDKRPPPAKRVEVPPGEDSFVALYEMLGATGSTPSGHAAREEAETILRAAINELPLDYAQVVRLHDLEGRSGGEVGAVMGRSRGAVVMLLARARDRLKETLGSATKFFSSRGR